MSRAIYSKKIFFLMCDEGLRVRYNIFLCALVNLITVLIAKLNDIFPPNTVYVPTYFHTIFFNKANFKISYFWAAQILCDTHLAKLSDYLYVPYFTFNYEVLPD